MISLPGNRYMKYDREERMAFLDSLMASGLSLNEIRRVGGFDYRTVKRRNPDYRPFEVGGGGDAATVRETNRRLREFEKRGRIGKNRDAGFNLRGGR